MYNHTVGAIASGGTLSFAEGEQINSIGNAQQVASYAKVIGDVAIATNVQYGYASTNENVYYERQKSGTSIANWGGRAVQIASSPAYINFEEAFEQINL